MDLLNLISLVTEQAVEHAAEESSGGVLGMLGINWKLFVAQIINFSVILFILWRWVFKPVGSALEARRQKIEESVKKAEEIEKARIESQTAREAEIKKARSEAEQILQKTLLEAENIKQQTVSGARTEAENILAQARQAIAAEKDKMFKEIRQEVADLVVMGTEKIIKEKLDEKKDRELINKALHEI